MLFSPIAKRFVARIQYGIMGPVELGLGLVKHPTPGTTPTPGPTPTPQGIHVWAEQWLN